MQMPAHLDHEDRQGQCRGKQCFVLQHSCFVGLVARPGRAAVGARGRRETCLCDLRRQRFGRYGSSQEGYERAFRGEVHAGIQHAGRGFQHPLNPTHTGRAGHRLDIQNHRVTPRRIARAIKRSGKAFGIGGGRKRHPRGFGGKVHGGRVHAFNRVQGTLGPPDAGRAGQVFQLKCECFQRSHKILRCDGV